MVFTFSFTSKETQRQPFDVLRNQFEQLDIKLLDNYSVAHTTHTVAKKRNTAKGLQALIHGKFMVSEIFLDEIVVQAKAGEGDAGSAPSNLESDFVKFWPDSMRYLPAPGGEPVQRPDSLYAPNLERRNVFEGYTFVFYDKTQYSNLLPPITDGGGKALFQSVTPGITQMEDFIRYVKSVAGEKGLGSFEDGSEGKGVVVVRYCPSKGDQIPWYVEFATTVALRLDHRPIEQRDFIDAILINDASKLRRPLETETPEQARQRELMEKQQLGNGNIANHGRDGASPAEKQMTEALPVQTRKVTRRQPIRKRFAGFDNSDSDQETPVTAGDTSSGHQSGQAEGGLFVSQEQSGDTVEPTRTSQRKRPASPLPEDDLMEGIAPSAEMFKRQRIERGEDIPEPTPSARQPSAAPAKPVPKQKKVKKNIDVLAVAARNREEEEARAKWEKQDIATELSEADLGEIRRLNIVEEMEVRAPQRRQDQLEDSVNDRWNPKWNGMKNFKKFRRRGEVTGRQPARTIISLFEAKTKEYGVGDDYWLEDDTAQKRPKSTVSQPSAPVSVGPANSRPTYEEPDPDSISDGSLEDIGDLSMIPATESSRPSRVQKLPSPDHVDLTPESESDSYSRPKRKAVASTRKPSPKRQKMSSKVIEIADSEGSDDDLKFKFGKRN